MPTESALPEGYESMSHTLHHIQQVIPHRHCRAVLVDLNTDLTLRIDRLNGEIAKAKAEMLGYAQGTSGRQYWWQERIVAERQLVEVQAIHKHLRDSLDRMGGDEVVCAECETTYFIERCPGCGGGDAA